jgi:hypothetical protein
MGSVSTTRRWATYTNTPPATRCCSVSTVEKDGPILELLSGPLRNTPIMRDVQPGLYPAVTREPIPSCVKAITRDKMTGTGKTNPPYDEI